MEKQTRFLRDEATRDGCLLLGFARSTNESEDGPMLRVTVVDVRQQAERRLATETSATLAVARR